MFSQTESELKSLKLVDHAHAGGDGIEGGMKLDLLAAEKNGPLVRPVKAVEDRHERRLAGAVLAHDGVDLAAFNGEIHVIVGNQRAVALDYADRLQFVNGHPFDRCYFAIIGSSSLSAPLTIWSRSSFTLAMTSG